MVEKPAVPARSVFPLSAHPDTIPRETLDQGFSLGDWWVEPGNGTLTREGQRFRLRPLQRSLLVYLASAAGRVVTKDELFTEVWQGAVVEEGALPRCVSELRRLLGDDAQHPTYIETVPRQGYRLVAPVRPPAESSPQSPNPVDEPHPGARGDQTLHDPPSEGDRAAAGPPSTDLPPGRRFRWVMPVVAVLLVLSVVWFGTPWRETGVPIQGAVAYVPLDPGQAPDPGQDPEPAQTTVAVLEFRSLSDTEEHAWLATALSEMLTSELALSPVLQVVPGEAVAQARRALSLEDVADTSIDNRGRLRDFLGIERLVYGSFLVLETDTVSPQLRIDVWVEDPEATEQVTSLVESGPRDELFTMVRALGSRLRRPWSAPAEQPEGAAVHESYLPRDPSANRLYLQGLHELRRFRARRARDLLTRSIAQEPEHPLSHRALAEAWAELGYASKALEVAEQANRLAAGLPRDLRLWIEAGYLEASSRWDEAIDVYRALWLFSPENIEYGLQLADAQRAAGRAREALETLEAIRARHGLGEPRVAIAKAQCYEHLGDKAQALQWAERAAQAGAEIQADLIVAEAHEVRAVALHALGRFDEATQAIERAASTFAGAGDHNSASWARTNLARWLSVRGDSASAEALLGEALEVFVDIGNRKGEARVLQMLLSLRGEHLERAVLDAEFERIVQIQQEIGNDRGLAGAYNSLGALEARHGRLKRAQALFEQALDFYRRADSADGINLVLTNLGIILGLQAEIDAALEACRESLEQAKALGDPNLVSLAQLNLGNAELLAGNLDPAEDILSAAEATWARLENPSWRASALDSLAEVAVEKDEREAARALYQEALALKQGLDDPNELAGSYASLALVEADGGDPAEAERLARRALELASPASSQHLTASTALAQALLAGGHWNDALQVVEEAEEALDPERTDDVFRVRLSIVGARALYETGEPAAALATLRRLRERVHRAGSWLLAAEADLALGAVELMTGDLEVGRARLQALEREATVRGCRRKARQAAEALASEVLANAK